MGSEMYSDISTLLSESYSESSPIDEISSDSDCDISAVLLESIKKSEENENKLDFSQEEIAFVDSCFAINGDENWDEIKNALIDALSAPNPNPNFDSDIEMKLGRDRESDESPNLEPREGIFGIWDLDFGQDSDEEIGLIKDLKRLLKSGDEEDSNLNLGVEKEKFDEIVADLGNLSLNQIENGWNDKGL